MNSKAIIFKLMLTGLGLGLLASCNAASPDEQITAELGIQVAAGSLTYTMPEKANGAAAKKAWAGGAKKAWAGGSYKAWAGGTSKQQLSENNAAWTKIGLTAAQTKANKLGAGVKVAVIDTGLDLSHPFFQGSLAPQNEWKDYIDGDNNPQEVGVDADAGYGHGTAVAGVILQVAPNATILPIRVLDTEGSGDTASIRDAINYASSMGAKIINLSLGTPTDGTVKMDCNIQSAIANLPDGIFVVTSSGNTGDQNVSYPGFAAKNNSQNQYAKACGISPSVNNGFNTRTVSVGSVNSKDAKSGFSTSGTNVEMYAPGENVFGPVPGSSMGAWNGTSFAAPMVSGALTLALGQPALAKPNTLKNLANFVANQSDAVTIGQRLNIPLFLANVLP